MYIVLRNTYAMEGNENTNQTKSFGTEGVSRFVFEGTEYSCGVNASVTVPDLVGEAWKSADFKMVEVSRS